MYHYGYYAGQLYAGAGLVVLAVALTALLVVLVLPKEKDGHLPGFFQLLYDVFSPKKLVVEKLLQILYVFLACLAVLAGLFTFLGSLFRLDMIGLLGGLFLLVVGPLLLRLAYELLMLLVIQVKTTREIHQKLTRLAPPDPEPLKDTAPEEGPPQEAPPTPQEPTVPKIPLHPAPDQTMVHCPACGTWYRKAQGTCPICGGNPETP